MENIHLEFKVKGEKVVLDLEHNDHVSLNVTVMVGEKGKIRKYNQQDMVTSPEIEFCSQARTVGHLCITGYYWGVLPLVNCSSISWSTRDINCEP